MLPSPPLILREAPGLTDTKGFIPVLPTYRHPDFESIYAVGVITQLKAVEQTPIPTGAPKVGLMSEEMALAVAHNIALELGVISGYQNKPTLRGGSSEAVTSVTRPKICQGLEA